MPATALIRKSPSASIWPCANDLRRRLVAVRLPLIPGQRSCLGGSIASSAQSILRDRACRTCPRRTLRSCVSLPPRFLCELKAYSVEAAA